MEECVTLAREFARELAEALDLPVYLYGEAALVPGRRSLADVRKGEFEGLREAVAEGEPPPRLRSARDRPCRRDRRGGAEAAGRVQHVPVRHR